MSNEVLILGVKGSGKTVFLSVLGHQYEGVGEFGLSLSPDRQTWKFAYEFYHTMAPEDGSEQRFPAATDPKDDPLPLTWLVRAGTETLFRMTTLECAGETMVEAFSGEGDAEAEERYSEEMTAAFDAMDANTAAGVASKADTVTKLRVMAKRASVVCLFLNPRDFESQVAALPGRYAERLERRLERLRAEGAGEAELSAARKASGKYLAKARDELKDRYGAMLDLLRTFLENPEYRAKRLVFVLTQAGGLERAIEEAGGAWGYLNANVRQLESHDLKDRAEAIAVSAVNGVALVEEPDGEERERPDGPIESTGLEDFLLTVGGTCSPRLESLKTVRGKCLAAELRFTEAMREGEPVQTRLETARQWRSAALEWMQATEHFLAGLGNVRAGVKQRTRAFAGADVARAERRWYAESALWSRLSEDVATGRELPAGDLEAWRAVADAAVERRNMGGWTLDELGLEEGWLAEAVARRQDEWRGLKRRFDAALARLDWEEAKRLLGTSGLDPMEETFRKMQASWAETRRSRAETECRRALEKEEEGMAVAKLKELVEAERDAGPSPSRAVLEEGLECLRARLEVRARLERLVDIRRAWKSGAIKEGEALAAARHALPLMEKDLASGEKSHGADNFRDLREEYGKWRRWLEGKLTSRSTRLRVEWVMAAVLVVLLALAWAWLRWQAKREMIAERVSALSEACISGNYIGAKVRLLGLRNRPWLGLKASEYVPSSLLIRLGALEDLKRPKADAELARKNLDAKRNKLVGQYGDGRLGLFPDWMESERLRSEGLGLMPLTMTDEYGLEIPDGDISNASGRYKKAMECFRNAEKGLDKVEKAAASADAAAKGTLAMAKAVLGKADSPSGTQSVAKREPGASPTPNRAVEATWGLGLVDWDAAARAAEKTTPDKLRAAKSPEEEWKNVLAEGKATREVPEEEWRAAGRRIDEILRHPESTTEERAAAGKRKQVCNAASAYFAEKERRAAVAGLEEKIKTAIGEKRWAEAYPLAQKQLAEAQIRGDKVAVDAVEKLLERIAAGTRASVNAALADRKLDAAAVKKELWTASGGTERLGDEVAAAVRGYLMVHYPENTPEAFPPTYHRDMLLLEDLGMTRERAELERRTGKWSRQWLAWAETWAETARTNARRAKMLGSAWDACKAAEAAVAAVADNPRTTPDESRRAGDILAELPYLLCVQGRKRGASGKTYQPQPIGGIGIDGEGLSVAGVRPSGEKADVAIVSVEMPCLKSGTAIPRVGSPKRFRHQFVKPGTQTVTVDFD